jgi:hypothetical protein
MDEGLAREMELFREALELPTVGMRQVGDLELLQSLIPAEAKRYVDELYGWRQEDPASPGRRRAPGDAVWSPAQQ